jgi:ATP-binding cassette subfamily B protein AbcA/BmrA
MERLYEPEEGEIFLNGENVADIPLDGYRKKFAYVQQDSGIFSGTVRDAMTYSIEREVSDEELICAATFTGAYDFVKKMTNGFDTEIAISGTSVSGGQRQRIALTREVLKNKDIMLLDEPTSALDATTAREIKDKIFELFCDKTLVMVTHDLGLISAADQIIVLFNGRIYASGIHAELMNTCDLYSELVNARAYEEVYGK